MFAGAEHLLGVRRLWRISAKPSPDGSGRKGKKPQSLCIERGLLILFGQAGFAVSHPCAKKKAHGWEIQRLEAT
jgi:hypothetical protein